MLRIDLKRLGVRSYDDDLVRSDRLQHPLRLAAPN